MLAALACVASGRLRIEGPVRQVDTVHALTTRTLFEVVRRQPPRGHPLLELVRGPLVVDLKRQETLGQDELFVALHFDDHGRPTEGAVIRLLGDDGTRPAAVALHLDSTLCEVSRPTLSRATETLGEGVLDDGGLRGRDVLLRSAVRAHERPSARLERQLRAAALARKLL